jgi:toxin FitB
VFLLDTNVLSQLRRSGTRRADSAVKHWFSQVDAGDLFVSVITILEIEMGIAGKERSDPRQGQILRFWLEDRVLPEFAGRMLPVSLEVARLTGRLHVPDRMPDRDALIAATARVHDLVLVTRNTRDFLRAGVRLADPWTAMSGS